jgi:hypothetical protein
MRAFETKLGGCIMRLTALPIEWLAFECHEVAGEVDSALHFSDICDLFDVRQAGSYANGMPHYDRRDPRVLPIT